MSATDALNPLALRPRDAAQALGISPRHLWQLTHDGHIPAVRTGAGKRAAVLYRVADLESYLAKNARGGKGGRR